MGASRSSYDVVVVGAGPVGAVTAIAFARQGAQVALLEADPRAANRFAGEWLHPTAVEVLDELRVGRIERARPRTGYGFVILPGDGSAPIEMPYAQGVALCAEHVGIVEALREVARGMRAIEYVPFARVAAVEGNLVRCEDRRGGGTFELSAGQIVGADGRASVVRRACGLPDRSQILSYMAAVELRDVELPFEGFGHVILGGPGPALLYRIGDDVVRGCFDVPVTFGSRARSRAFLWDAFHPVLPPSLRPAFRAALERGPSRWAANRFRPRVELGRGTLALVGDAAGHVHPMTAIGITMGLLDARALARSRDLEQYERERRAHVPELLSNALYHCFRRDDPSATEVRRAMFRTLRASEAERRRTMQILAASDPRRRSFGSAFVKIAAQAIGASLADTARQGRWHRLPGAISQYGEWMQWPAAVALPRRLDRRVRARSTATHPLPFLARFVPSAEVLVPRHGDADGGATRAAGADERLVHAAIEAGHRILLAELEAIARVLGAVPDAAIAGPGTRMMRAITAGMMRPAMAARMTIGRRRLALEGLARLLGLGDWRATQLAELLLVLLDGASWTEEPIAQLDEGVRALLECQTVHGGFALRARHGLPTDHEGDLESTALACRALEVVSRRRPDASAADVAVALARAGAWLRGRQSADGSWPAIAPFGGGTPDPIVRTALGIEALVAIDGHPGERAVRQATQWLASRATGEDGWAKADVGEPRSLLVAAAALRAMCAAGAASHEHVARGIERLVAAMDAGLREAEGLPVWEQAAAIVEALALYEAHRAERPTSLAARPRAGAVSAVGRSAPEGAGTAAIPEVDPRDWAFCKQALREVSRTFSRPIALLPPKLEVAVTLGYLLCRIADTVEDHPSIDGALRDRLFAQFLDVLERGADPGKFAQAFAAVPGDDPELSLAREIGVVMRVFATRSESTRAACIRWVGEMARGMSLYAHRRPERDGLVALHTTSDLERYCYYVAGTVGHLLTDLFLEELGPDATPERALALREDAESFAMGLQLVNILKDVTDDRARGWSFVPRTAVARHGIGLVDLCDPHVRGRAHAAVAPIFDLARNRLDAALRYALAIPPSHAGIRLFCLLPLWMAARTLVLARGNDAMFIPGQPVKISRDEVEALIADCVRHVADDEALRAHYERLYEDEPPVRRAGSSAS